MEQPLAHIRVLELSRILAGPWAGQLLADFGADVVKIENPHGGDDTRHWGPPYLKDTNGVDTSESAYFLSANRGKQSITIDIRTKQGQKVIHDLVTQSDVFIENYKVGALRKYNLDYESIFEINPQIIYCSITGFGQDGPYAARAGYDFMLQGMGGLMSVTGEVDGQPGGGPQKVGVALTDILTGMYAVTAVQAALIERDKSECGQHIDLALFDVQLAGLANQAMNYLVGDQVPQRMGNAHPNIVPYQSFATRDGFIILAVGNDKQFRHFCEAADCTYLADDPRFSCNQFRVVNRIMICQKISQIIIKETSCYWLTLLEEKGVPCGPVNDIRQAFNDPQAIHRGTVEKLSHPYCGDLPTVANPIKFSRTPISHVTAPPLLGENTDHVLSSTLGYSKEKISSLYKDKVI